MWQSPLNLDKFIFSTIIGGALGNFYDRLTFNAVPDFIDLHYNSFHWFIFNVADIFITLGIIIFIMRGFFEKTNLLILLIFLFIVSCGNVGKILRNEKIKSTDEF